MIAQRPWHVVIAGGGVAALEAALALQARAEGRVEVELVAPEPDFGGLARAMGCYGEGPIDKPQDVRPALLRALAEVKKGRLALVDTITQHR